jgi:hypothetical protein
MNTAQTRARAQQNEVDLHRLEYHRRLVGLLLGKRTQGAVLSRAWREVRRWQRRRLCSLDYSREWSKLLYGPVNILVAQMLDKLRIPVIVTAHSGRS